MVTYNEQGRTRDRAVAVRAEHAALDLWRRALERDVGVDPDLLRRRELQRRLRRLVLAVFRLAGCIRVDGVDIVVAESSRLVEETCGSKRSVGSQARVQVDALRSVGLPTPYLEPD